MILRETGAIPLAALPVAALADELRLGFGFADDGAEDAVLERLLREAIGVIEARTATTLIRRGFELTVDRWDSAGHLVLPVGPVESIAVFEIVATGTEFEGCRLGAGSSRQRVTAPGGGALPALGTVRLAFEAGFGPTWDEVPADLRRAVLMLAAHGYENGAEAVPAGVLALLDMRRPVRL